MTEKDLPKLKYDAGAIVINKKTRAIALIKMHHNVWGFPKGGIKENESTLNAAKREVYEETGIKEVEVIAELPPYQRPNSYKLDERLNINMYIFETDEDDLKPVGYDIAEVKWVAIEDVPATLTMTEDIDFFMEVRHKII
ncbi:MAG: hypothetical protein A2469_01825 [Candidatus Magasanikbacteria bacterium RIFOXYC2_FULL_40_16]|uniref:Nudix hydrolase domain-containing protein n=3 Tax=Candidatus Magasanikiibacteriota TaxID=1752731 RepID=A0A1F6NJ64_9BACT|nr:MAG: hypothetical protein A2373_01395 [Candidatus Magasanikbacteria bacterium RIFOXYB1_FULL_40_15]OGH85549.1 MAG: hypothetical protein A2301_01980 [Candidatus Magasanikbacteria bacterium RIFOXYB2_FULL_40_13]OGH87955.1 MAG: hypothetical protein A2206_01430 [Candidatus Magasanikbacteria bacterium RIFOXYA1_FULL_40_8]OGH90108.1 MAG: hypothetical protein A2469_01825 [Candidatus Magasanikbacteria bacterium RIFOXYC2_FULL_40_16]